MKRMLAMLSMALLMACSGGHAVRVECEGRLTAINAPVAAAPDARALKSASGAPAAASAERAP